MDEIQVVSVFDNFGLFIGYRGVVKTVLAGGLVGVLGCTCPGAHETEHTARSCEATKQIISKHRRAA